MILAPVVFLAAVHLLHPAAEPQLNVEPSCRAASHLNLADGQSFKACMRDELEAKDEVAKNWATYRAEARSRCSAEVMIGGDPSYVELFACLEIDKSLASDHNDLEGTDAPALSLDAPHDGRPQR